MDYPASAEAFATLRATHPDNPGFVRLFRTSPHTMIFTDGTRTRGRFTKAERGSYGAAALELGLDPRGSLSNGEAAAALLLTIAGELGPGARAQALALLTAPDTVTP